MSLCCPICEGDEKFCKENGCGSEKVKEVTDQIKKDLRKALSEGHVGEAKVKCPRCNKPIHINDFGGITKDGVFHGSCIVMEELTKE